MTQWCPVIGPGCAGEHLHVSAELTLGGTDCDDQGSWEQQSAENVT